MSDEIGMDVRYELEKAIGRRLSDDEWRVATRHATAARPSESRKRGSGAVGGVFAFVGVNIGMILALTLAALPAWGGMVMVNDSGLFGDFLKLKPGTWDGGTGADMVQFVALAAYGVAVLWVCGLLLWTLDPDVLPWAMPIGGGVAAAALPLGGAAYALAADGTGVHVLGGVVAIAAVAIGAVVGGAIWMAAYGPRWKCGESDARYRVSMRSSSTSGCRPSKRLSMNSLVKSAMNVPSDR